MLIIVDYSPEGGYSPRVWVWSLRTGAVAQCGGATERDTKNKYENTAERNNQIQHNHQDDIEQREHDANGHQNEHDGNINDGFNNIRPGSSNMSNNEHVSNESNGNFEPNGEQESDPEHDISDDENHKSNKGIGDVEIYNNEVDYASSSAVVTDDNNINNNIAGNNNIEEHNTNYNNDVAEHDDLSIGEREHGSSTANGSGDNSDSFGAVMSGSGHAGNSVSAVDYGSRSDRGSSERRERNSESGSMWDDGGGVSGSDGGYNVFDGGVSEREKGNSGSRSINGGESGSGSADRRGSGSGRGRGRAQHGGAALCALLPRDDPAALLVLAADDLYVSTHSSLF